MPAILSRLVRASLAVAVAWLAAASAVPVPRAQAAAGRDLAAPGDPAASELALAGCTGTVMARPEGLKYGGPDAYAGLAMLDCHDDAWWGEILEPVEAVALMLRFEVGDYLFYPHVSEAATRKYNEFCRAGAWTPRCFNGFWAYYQVILDADKLLARMIRFDQERRFQLFLEKAQDVINNPRLGGQAGYRDRPSEWVVILEENATEPVWRWARTLRMGSADDEVFFRADYYQPIWHFEERGFVDARRIVLVLSFNQLADPSSPCRPVGLGCNLARVPYTR